MGVYHIYVKVVPPNHPCGNFHEINHPDLGYPPFLETPPCSPGVNPFSPRFRDVPSLTIRRTGAAAADAGALLTGARLWRHPNDHGIIGVAWRKKNWKTQRLGDSGTKILANV